MIAQQDIDAMSREELLSTIMRLEKGLGKRILSEIEQVFSNPNNSFPSLLDMLRPAGDAS